MSSSDEGLRVYFCGRFRRRYELAQYALDLQQHRIIVTSRWLQEAPETDAVAQAAVDDPSAGCLFARRDLVDLMSSHVVCAFTEQPNTMHDNNGGKDVEFGFGLGQHLLPIVVGPIQNIFHSIPEVKVFPVWGPDVIDYLSGIAGVGAGT